MQICWEEVEGAEENLEVGQIATSKACDDARKATEEASKFEADYVAYVGRRRDEVGAWTKQ